MVGTGSLMLRRAQVAYFYDPELGSYYYGPGHPMKPHRVRMAHNLVLHYGLHNKMEASHSYPCCRAHLQGGVQFLALSIYSRINPILAIVRYATHCRILPALSFHGLQFIQLEKASTFCRCTGHGCALQAT